MPNLSLLENLKVEGGSLGTLSLDRALLLNHTIVHKTSFLAAWVLREDHDQQVCHSAAGYYIGAQDDYTGEPLARDSAEYWENEEDAQKALKDRSWTQRLNP